MNEPYSLELNAAVMTMANRVLPKGYDVSDHAPSSLAELIDEVERTGRICVSRQHSDNTVFGDPEHNYAFRAWHDWTHWRYRCDFDLPGEVRVALYQLADLAKLYGRGFADRYKPLILAEVVGQAMLHECTGSYPSDQPAFDAAFMSTVSPKAIATTAAL